MARRNPALGQLDTQLKDKYPGIVIGWIADSAHSSQSDHAVDSDGTVDALDPMLGSAFRNADADTIVNALVASRDKRIKYIIWENRIISSVVQPWVWRPYSGSDPHTGHFHISSVQEYEKDASAWRINSEGKKMEYKTFGVRVPVIRQGDNDDQYDGYNMIYRIQGALGVDRDGDYGPKTAAAVKAKCGGDGKYVDERAYRIIFGLG